MGTQRKELGKTQGNSKAYPTAITKLSYPSFMITPKGLFRQVVRGALTQGTGTNTRNN
jgi:hypothetical protein